MKYRLKAPGTKRLKLKYDVLLSCFAFNFILRRYTAGLAYVGGGWGLRRGAAGARQAARLAAEVAALEAAIAGGGGGGGGGGPFLMGPELSLADLVLYPFAERFELAMREFQGCELRDMGGGDGGGEMGRWLAAMAARESAAGASTRPPLISTSAACVTGITRYIP